MMNMKLIAVLTPPYIYHGVVTPLYIYHSESTLTCLDYFLPYLLMKLKCDVIELWP